MPTGLRKLEGAAPAAPRLRHGTCRRPACALRALTCTCTPSRIHARDQPHLVKPAHISSSRLLSISHESSVRMLCESVWCSARLDPHWDRRAAFLAHPQASARAMTAGPGLGVKVPGDAAAYIHPPFNPCAPLHTQHSQEPRATCTRSALCPRTVCVSLKPGPTSQESKAAGEHPTPDMLVAADHLESTRADILPPLPLLPFTPSRGAAGAKGSRWAKQTVDQ